MELRCLRKDYRKIRAGKLDSLIRDVYRLDNFVIKVKKDEAQPSFQKAKAEDAYQRYLREIFKNVKELILPKHYGTVYTAVYKNGSWQPATLTISEYIEGKLSPKDLFKICKIWAGLLLRCGITVDLKYGHFRKKGNKLVYLDEHAIGRPPDDWFDFFRVLKRLFGWRKGAKKQFQLVSFDVDRTLTEIPISDFLLRKYGG